MSKKHRIMLVLSFLIASVLFPQATFGQSYPTSWDMTLLYATEADFENDYNQIMSNELPQYESTLGDDRALEAFLVAYETYYRTADKMYVYAASLCDMDSTDDTYQDTYNTALQAYTKLDEDTAFFMPELLERSDENILALTEQDAFAPYASFLTDISQARDAILSEESEVILALANSWSEAPSNIYDQLNTSDFKYESFTDHFGNVHTFDPSTDIVYLYATDPEWRTNAYDAIMAPYISHANTYAAIYIAEVEKNIFQARARGYDSTLEYVLDGVIDPSDYTSLIAVTKQHADLIGRYFELRGQALGVDTFLTSDLYLPYTPDAYGEVTYDEGVDLVRNALSVLGDSYSEDISALVTGNTIDVYPDTYKTSSQYTWGAYGEPVYILLNYYDELDDAFTLAHELGHAVQQKRTNELQGYFDANVSPFPGELPSTLNELLMLDYMKENAVDDSQSLELLATDLDLFYDTFFSQVILADFENQVYERAESGESLTLDVLNTLWLDVNRTYFGDAVDIQSSFAYDWMQIPHLYQNHYVYSYAMSITAAADIFSSLKADQTSVKTAYNQFLSGEIDFDQLDISFDDLSVYNAVFNHFEDTLDALDSIVSEPDFESASRTNLFTMSEIEDYLAAYSDSGSDASSTEEIFFNFQEDGSLSDESAVFIIIIGAVIALWLATLLLIVFLLLDRRSLVKKIKRLEEPPYHSPEY